MRALATGVYFLVTLFGTGSARATPVVPTATPMKLSDFLQSAEWKHYLDVLDPCQKMQPGVYAPIEIIRVDRLPETNFVAQAQDFVRQSRALHQQNFSKDVQNQMQHLSCVANAKLYDLTAQAGRDQKQSMLGSSVSVVHAIPPEMRRALTPLDALFQGSSEVGKKIVIDLKKRPEMNLEAVSINAQKKTISFQGQPGAWQRAGLAPVTYYQLQISEIPGGQTRFRGTYVNSTDAASADLAVRTENLDGSLFQAGAPTFLPLGAYPAGAKVWADEAGISHFAGDGHNHAH